MKQNIQIVSAPSILGLKPSGVEYLAESLLDAGLVDDLNSNNPVIYVVTQNDSYSSERDKKTNCLNPLLIHDFSLVLSDQIFKLLNIGTFPIVLGGDGLTRVYKYTSILILTNPP